MKKNYNQPEIEISLIAPVMLMADASMGVGDTSVPIEGD